MAYREVQCDGLIGPTHNYAGLSFGNIASEDNAGETAYPKQAALQGLEKMRFVHELGCTQLILPPPLRPNMALLERLGVQGVCDQDATLSDIIRSAWSASTMWAANAATISPAPDTEDGQLHITIANLVNSLHRAQEADERYTLFTTLFGAVAQVHPPLSACVPYGDEGAANHMRLSASHGDEGVEIFVYGRDDASGDVPHRFPARQTRKASEAVARLHHVPKERCVFVQQHPHAIDQGVFHNDVIAMSNEHVLLYHEYTFHDEADVIAELQDKADFPLTLIRISDEVLPLADAVSSYFYNSQLLSLSDGMMAVIAPYEVKENKYAYAVMEALLQADDNPISAVHYLDVRESMRNGGGPACLRLRIVMEDAMIGQIATPYLFSPQRYEVLKDCIERYYPTAIVPNDIYSKEMLHHVTLAHEQLMALV